jgi:hypothetical protein
MVDGRGYAVRTSHIVTLISVASYGTKRSGSIWLKKKNLTGEAAGVRVFQLDDCKFMLAKSKIIWMLLHFSVRCLALECLSIHQLRDPTSPSQYPHWFHGLHCMTARWLGAASSVWFRVRARVYTLYRIISETRKLVQYDYVQQRKFWNGAILLPACVSD